MRRPPTCVKIEVNTSLNVVSVWAPVVVVSMASSSQDDVPRGLEFLLERNRLNVAVSRAQWVAHIVHSPQLESFSPASVAQLVLLGGFLGLDDAG